MSSHNYTNTASIEEAQGAECHDNIYAAGEVSEQEEETDAPLQEMAGDGNALDTFVMDHALPRVASSRTTSIPQLACPVVIPQRRPGNKARGFVEAYAPALEQFGILQDEFISLIQAVNKVVQASKWLGAIQLAAVGTSFVPNSIALGVSMAVQVVAAVIAKAETRWKTNSLLDRVNDEFFRPRGLYCLLMSYNPIAIGEKEQLNVADTISNREPPSISNKQSLLDRARQNLRNPVSGIAEGVENLPLSAAPLVYPDASNASKLSAEPKKRNTMKRLNNYFDQRAQARYAKESKRDILSNPSPPQFKNRYLDPNHPATNGGFLGLVSGGYLTPDQEKVKDHLQSMFDAQNQAVSEQRSASMASLRQQLALMNLPPEQELMYIKQYEHAFKLQEQQVKQQASLASNGLGQRRIIRNILYLMIVQTPSDEEIAKARRSLETSNGMLASPEVALKTVEA